MTGSFGSISTELTGCVYLENERVVGFGAAVVHRVQTAAVAAGVHVADDAADADIFRRLGRLRQRLQPQIKSNQIKSNQIKSINQLAERPATAECSLSDAGIALYRTESPRRSIDGVASKSTTQRQKIQKRNQPKCNNDNNDNNVHHHHHHHHQIGWRERLRVAPLATQPSKRGNKRETPSERALPAALRNSIVSADKQKKKVCQALIQAGWGWEGVGGWEGASPSHK